MNSTTNFLVTLALIPLLATTAYSAPKQPAGKLVPLVPIIDNSYLLKGTVEHSDKLAPVPETLRTGAMFDKSKLETLTKDNSWYQIPEWFSGHWLTEEQTSYYEFDYQTGDEDHRRVVSHIVSHEDVGWQRDRIGGIWHRIHYPYTTLSEGVGVFFVGYVKLNIPLFVSQDKVILRYQSVSATVSRYSGRVIKSEQRESIQTYTPATTYGFLKCVSSMKHFDENGAARTLTQAVTGSTRTEKFSPINTYKGINTLALFKAYLTKRGLTDRIP